MRLITAFLAACALTGLSALAGFRLARASTDTVTVTRSWLNLTPVGSDYRICINIASSNGASKNVCGTLSASTRNFTDDNGTVLGTLSVQTMTDLGTCKTDITNAVSTLESGGKLPL